MIPIKLVRCNKTFQYVLPLLLDVLSDDVVIVDFFGEQMDTVNHQS